MNSVPKILIVDDELFNIDYLEQELEDLHYDIISATNGQDAVMKAESESPDLVLLDIMMPITDGFEVLSRLKASPRTVDIPVIIISANNDLQSVVKGVKQGADDYLPKPFEPVLLHARIDAGLAKKRQRDQELEYLSHVALLISAASAIEQSVYEPEMIDAVMARSDMLGELARVFGTMAQEVRTREQRLKRQLEQLQRDIEEQALAKSETVAIYIPMDRRQAFAHGTTLPEYAHGAALFADVYGFTAVTESLANELGLQRGAEEIIRHLNRVYTALIDNVHRYEGSVVSFSGDAITCWFDDLDIMGNQRTTASAERAAACALAMQKAMVQFATIITPGGTKITLAIKVAVAAGPARRFLVGEFSQHQIDVLAGNTLTVLASAQEQARRGEIVMAAGLPDLEEQFVVSEWRNERNCAVISGLMHDVVPVSWPNLPDGAIVEAQARPWMLPVVFEKVRAGKSELLSELRSVAALFLRFDGLDYDTDVDAAARLDSFVQWVEQVVERYNGSILQLSVGDKGNYLYIGFGAPVAHNDDAMQAVSAALELAEPPEELSYITDLQIGLSYGQMRVGAYGGSTHRTYGAIGDKTNLASRLMQVALPAPVPMSGAQRASILCDSSIYEITHAQFEFDSLPPIVVKGKAQPIAIYRPIRKRLEGYGDAENLVGRTVERALLIDQLSPAEQLTLKVASVIGQVFTFDALSSIYPEEHEREHLRKNLRTLEELDLIVQRSTESASYSFKDMLTHETAYSLMLFAQRRQIHRAVAEWLEMDTSTMPLYAELAHHWQAADDIPKAVHYLEKAGEYARHLGDYEEASRFFNASLALNI